MKEITKARQYIATCLEMAEECLQTAEADKPKGYVATRLKGRVGGLNEAIMIIDWVQKMHKKKRKS